MNTIHYSIALLVATSLIGFVFCAIFINKHEVYFSIRALVLANYVVIQAVSGIAHLEEWGLTKGYFDIASRDEDYVWQANLATVVGLVFLVIGCRGGRTRRASREGATPLLLSSYDALLIIGFVVFFGPLSVYGLVQVHAIVEGLGGGRIIALAGGAARFSFLAHWFTWVVCLPAILILGMLQKHSYGKIILIACSATVLIALSLLWSGGRSVIIVMSLPLMLFVAPMIKGFRTIISALSAIAIASFLLTLSEMRSRTMVSSTGVSVGNWFDWEWGRYSMVGLSMEFIIAKGHLWGETFVAGIIAAIAPLLSLFGLGEGLPQLRTSYNVTSIVLFGNVNYIHVVPGFTAELYMNFGLVGVAIGYAALGRGAWWVERRLAVSTGAVQRLLLLYIGVLLAFRVIPSDSASFLFYAAYSGGPLILAALLSWMVQRATKRNGRQLCTIR